MQVFQKVAELGSFSAAATQMELSKSAVSKTVRALEDHLGAKLLNRTTRHLSLTEAGGRYIQQVGRLLGELAEIEAEAGCLQAVPRGRLRVNAPMSFGLLHIAPILPDLLRAQPELTIDLTLNDRVVDLLDEGFDVAIRIGRLQDSSLVARKLGETELVLVASPQRLRADGAPTTPNELRARPCLVYAYGPYRDEWYLEVGGEPLHVRIAGSLRANIGEALRSAAERGLGIALLPDFLVEEAIAAGRLERVLPDVTGGVLPIHAIYPPNRLPLAKLNVFVEHLRQHLVARRRSA